MLAAPALSGRRYLVYGLARSGLAAIGFLQRSGADVSGWDEAEPARDNARATFPALTLASPADDLSRFDAIVVSPGVPLNRHPLAARARAAGVPLIGDIELFQLARAALPEHKVAAITGTNGKTTTTALLHHLLETAGIKAQLGGNIGLPILDQPPLPAGGVYVLELSSFQIDLCHTLAADVALFTNLTPDHLDRYDGMAGYAASKARLFTMQQPGSHAVIATDDDYSRALATHLPAGVSLHRVSAHDIAAADQARWPALQGPHNAQNAALAIRAAAILGADPAAIERGLENFPGLPHRMETIGTFGGVRYVNDSKATNPTSVAPALQAFAQLHWILGGHAKTDELDACLPHLGHVKAAYVIGEAAPLYQRLLSPHLPVTNAGTLEAAVRAAATAAVSGDTVLLSPACSSYDQFRDFEQRGDTFRQLVKGLRA